MNVTLNLTSSVIKNNAPYICQLNQIDMLKQIYFKNILYHFLIVIFMLYLMFLDQKITETSKYYKIKKVFNGFMFLYITFWSTNIIYLYFKGLI